MSLFKSSPPVATKDLDNRPSPKLLLPKEAFFVYEVKGEGKFAVVAILVGAKDEKSAIKYAREASLVLQSGKILNVQKFPEVLSSKFGVFAKYEWRKMK